MHLKTKFTEKFGLQHPIALAPMAGVAGGALAGAVAQEGALGLLGGGYGDPAWLWREWDLAGDAPIGVGFITWRLKPSVLDQALQRGPRAVMLSFGAPDWAAAAVHNANIPLICQCTTLGEVRAAIDAGAQVIVAQGGEAGGHGASRGTMSFVPEVADYLAGANSSAILLAAGGIADGRGLAAALMLGAEGVLVGSRFWATREALVPKGFHDAALRSGGDATARGRVPDVARDLAWPKPYTIRTLSSDFITRWQDDLPQLASTAGEAARRAFLRAQAAGDAVGGAPIVGEAVGLIADIPSAAQILTRFANEAAAALGRAVTPTA